MDRTPEPVDLAAVVDAVLARPGPVRLVAVDGPGGAGKSTFAARLAEAASGAPVLHTDDDASDDEPVRRARVVARDGAAADAAWAAGSAAEDEHYRRDPTRDRADLVIDGQA